MSNKERAIQLLDAVPDIKIDCVIAYMQGIIAGAEEKREPSKEIVEAIDLMEMLPESEQNFALEFIKKLVLAWDPDFTKLTPKERASLEEAKADNETVSHDDINWD